MLLCVVCLNSVLFNIWSIWCVFKIKTLLSLSHTHFTSVVYFQAVFGAIGWSLNKTVLEKISACPLPTPSNVLIERNLTLTLNTILTLTLTLSLTQTLTPNLALILNLTLKSLYEMGNHMDISPPLLHLALCF